MVDEDDLVDKVTNELAQESEFGLRLAVSTQLASAIIQAGGEYSPEEVAKLSEDTCNALVERVRERLKKV